MAIFGDPAETYATAQINAVVEEHLVSDTPYFDKTIPGSRIYDYACDNGLITDRVQYLKDGCPQISPK